MNLRSRLAVTALYLLGAAALAGAALSQQHPSLAHAMYANGFTRAVCVDRFEPTPPGCDPGLKSDQPGACTGVQKILAAYPANPNAVLAADRYGYGAHGCKGSPGGGEASGCTVVDAYVRAGFLRGFNPPDYSCERNQQNLPSDLSDTWYFTRDGRTTAYAAMKAAVGTPGPAPSPTPPPTPRPTPTPGPPPRPTPTPTPTPCPDCQAYAPVVWPERLIETREQMGDWNVIGAGRRARLRELAKWLEQVFYAPSTRSTGQVESSLPGEAVR